MNAFEYAQPATLDEAQALLTSASGPVAVLAGGTDLLTAMKQGIVNPARVVSLKSIEELRGIEVSSDAVRIGAMTTLSELAAHPDVARLYPCLVTAIKGIGSPQIANMGTVGGDLCQHPRCWYYRNGFGLFGMNNGASLVLEGDNRYHAIFGNDGPAKFVNVSSLAPGLIALDATFNVRGADKQMRDIPAADFFKTPSAPEESLTSLAAGEVLTHITIPAAQTRNATYEVRERHGLDWPLVTASVAYTDAGGSAQNVRVVLGHVAPTPWVVDAAAKTLEGKAIDEAAAAACGTSAVADAKPLSMNGYKVQLAKVAVKRALLAAAG
ncbi:MAG: xanthine dehydrogenase family protein subunit M [Candidatus Hydrogenedentes bacterium]|nr:xanthine dehydrogenase family protein subunit M [Candidatus Hydrogenedentota bacterium]